jgi:hypothetical protein
MAAIASDFDTAIHNAITGLRGLSYSWAGIAARLGVTRQAAQQRYGATTPPPSSEAVRPHDRPLPRRLLPRLRQPPGHPLRRPRGASEEYGSATSASRARSCGRSSPTRPPRPPPARTAPGAPDERPHAGSRPRPGSYPYGAGSEHRADRQEPPMSGPALAEALPAVDNKPPLTWREFSQATRQYDRTGRCQRPIRLSGRSAAVDLVTGELRPMYDTNTDEPGGVLHIPCGNRSCARTWPRCSARSPFKRSPKRTFVGGANVA